MKLSVLSSSSINFILETLNKKIHFILLFILFLSALLHGSVTVESRTLIYGLILFTSIGFLFYRLKNGLINFNGTSADRYIIILILYVIISYGISQYRYATELYLLQFFACLLMFYLCLNIFPNRNILNNFITGLVFGGGLFAVLGLVLTGGDIFGYRIFSKGLYNISLFFVNRNHYAGFLEMIFPFGLGLALIYNREKRILLFFVSAVMAIAILFSLSRGGILGLVCGILLFSGMLLLLPENRRSAAPVAVVIACIILLVTWLDISPLVERIHTLQNPQEAGQGRLLYWSGTVEMIRNAPWTGTGLGTYRYVYPRFQPEKISTLAVTHAHNDYLELAAEMGLIGLILVLGILLFFIIRAIRSLKHLKEQRDRIITISAFSSILSILVHTFFEFNFHILSNALLFGMILAVLVLFINKQRAVTYEYSIQPNRRYWIYFGLSVVCLVPAYIIVSIYLGNFFYGKSRTLFKSGEYEAAISSISTAIFCSAGNAEYQSYAGDIMMQRAYGVRDSIRSVYINQALGYYHNAIDECPARSYYYTKVAFVFQRLRKYPEAEQMFKKAIYYGPAAPFNYYNLAIFYLESKQNNKALEMLKQFIQFDKRNLKTAFTRVLEFNVDYDQFRSMVPDREEFRLYFANLLLGAGFDDEALREYEKAYTVRPSVAIALKHLQALQRMKKNREALSTARSYSRDLPEDQELQQRLAILYEKNDSDAQALALYRGMIRKWSKKTQLYIESARIYAKNAEFDSAIAVLNEGLNHVNDRANIYFILTFYYQKASKREEALMAIKEAVKLKPYSVRYRFQLGRQYQTFGLLQEAVDEWGKCLQLDPSHEPSRKAIDAVLNKFNL